MSGLTFYPQTPLALVTGASSGIGRAIARALADAGAHVGLLGRSQERLEETARELRQAGGRAEIYPVDLSSTAEISALVDFFGSQHAHLDVLVHSAGILSLGPVAAASVSTFDELFAVNVRAPYALTHGLLPLLIQGKGQVVFINSTAGLTAAPNVSQYAATKFALRAVADSLRQEVNPEGVRVLTVYPGRTASPMQAAVHAAEGKTYQPERLLQPGDVAEAVLAALRLPRSAEITEIHVRPFLKT